MCQRFAILLPLLLASLAPIAACSSDSDEPAPATSLSNTTRISAKDGGKVSDPSGKATLTIPAGALAEDTDITLSVSAATDETVAGIYDFGPDGLAFLKPATLEIAVDAAAVGDKQVAVALETEGTFVALAGSSYGNGVAQAEIEHFSKFTVIAVLGEDCEDEADKFTACGGDIVGTWEAVAACSTEESSGPMEGCPSGRAMVDIEAEGASVTFSADGTWAEPVYKRKQTITYEFPLSCFPGKGDSCATLDIKAECTGESQCTCTQEDTRERGGLSGTYSADAATGHLTRMQDGYSDIRAYEYCVSGDTLTTLYTRKDELYDYRIVETYRKK